MYLKVLKYFSFGILIGIILFFTLSQSQKETGLLALEKRYEVTSNLTKPVSETLGISKYQNIFWTFINNLVVALSLSYLGVFISIYKIGKETKWFYKLIGFKAECGLYYNKFAAALFPYGGIFLNGFLIGFILLISIASGVPITHLPFESFGLILSAAIGERIEKRGKTVKTKKEWMKFRKTELGKHQKQVIFSIVVLFVSSVLEWSFF